jgi:copper chaperone CopZ
MKTTAYKSVAILLVSLLTMGVVNAQLKSATLQASGLTCAMCSKAINNALSELSFVRSVKSDIKNSSFLIDFKPEVKVDIDRVKKAVEDAGFAVARLRLAANFSNLPVKHDEHVQVQGTTFHFLNVKNQTLNGEKQITVVDKNFLLSREYKKFSTATQMKCFQTGKAAACCSKEGVSANARVYHVTI